MATFELQHTTNPFPPAATFAETEGRISTGDDIDFTDYQNQEVSAVPGKSCVELLNDYRKGLAQFVELSGSEISGDMHSITLSRRYMGNSDSYQSLVDKSVSLALGGYQFGDEKVNNS